MALYTNYIYPFELAAMLLLVAIIVAIVLTMRHRKGLKVQDVNRQVATRARGPVARAEDAAGEPRMITLQHMLVLSGLLFTLSVAGIFINRKNVILLLMCIELLLLSANFNFVAFSRYLGNIDGQVFVFFVLTVAAAEAAIGLAILVVLFRAAEQHQRRRNQHAEGLIAEHGSNALNPSLLLAIPLLPLVAAIIAGLFGRWIGRRLAAVVTISGRGGLAACCPASCSSRSSCSTARRCSTRRSTPGWSATASAWRSASWSIR